MDFSKVEKLYFFPFKKSSISAFGSIMFAFAGASTFPTIQADMKVRSKFPISATIAIGSKSNVDEIQSIQNL